jgi:ASTRA-associated protein 1
MESDPIRLIQSSTLHPAQPAYVLRGHTAQIHAVHFLRDNLRLLTGDAEGWVVLWNVPIRRPAAVWRAHTDVILGLGSWDDDKIITSASPRARY